jgi:hypothetical protein
VKRKIVQPLNSRITQKTKLKTTLNSRQVITGK